MPLELSSLIGLGLATELYPLLWRDDRRVLGHPSDHEFWGVVGRMKGDCTTTREVPDVWYLKGKSM